MKKAISKKPAAKANPKQSGPKVKSSAVAKKKATPKKTTIAKPKSAIVSKEKNAATTKVVLLSGGNPQIAKGDGEAPVQAYISAMPEWKHGVGQRLDALITRTVPGVKKAVKWNTPFYGLENEGWFLCFHCISKYVKVAFFKGGLLNPLPPVESKQKEVRYFHIHEHDVIDENLLLSWIKQASQIPGWVP